MNQIPRQAIQQCARIAGLVLTACAFIGVGADASARPHRVSNQPVIRVSIYNYAHVYSLDLHDAERQAAFLFAMAGVRIEWTVRSQKQRGGRPQPEDSGADFVVRIIPASMAAHYSPKPGVLGQSRLPSGIHRPTPGGAANAFYESVKDLASDSGAFIGEALGDVMAHELGHLLLGSEHSSGGIMKARWTIQELRIASQGGLPFSPAEAVLLQTAARSLPRNSLTMAVARR